MSNTVLGIRDAKVTGPLLIFQWMRDMETEEINAMCAVVDIYIMHSGITGPA